MMPKFDLGQGFLAETVTKSLNNDEVGKNNRTLKEIMFKEQVVSATRYLFPSSAKFGHRPSYAAVPSSPAKPTPVQPRNYFRICPQSVTSGVAN